MLYGFWMGLAVSVGVLLSLKLPKPAGLRPGQRLAIGLGAYCGAMIGAKLPFVVTDWEGFRSGYAWFSDGKTIMLGLVGGYFGVVVAKWIMQIDTRTGDSFAVPVPAAIAVGRLGCFFAPCCYGTPSNLPWACDFGDGLLRHPTQLYESAFHLSAALILWTLLKRGLFPGQLVKIYILSYLVYRFLTEFIRPEPRALLHLTHYQWASLIFFPLFLLLLLTDTRRLSPS